jgi:hypothetical protein
MPAAAGHTRIIGESGRFSDREIEAVYWMIAPKKTAYLPFSKGEWVESGTLIVSGQAQILHMPGRLMHYFFSNSSMA